MKTCRICKLDKELVDFSQNKTKKDKLNAECKECQKASFKKYYEKNKDAHIKRVTKCVKSKRKKLWAIKLELKCNRCGYDKHPAALQFHHTNPEEKLFDVSRGVSDLNWEATEKEIEKCECVCANCHAIEHCRFSIDELNVEISKETKSRPEKRRKTYKKYYCHCGEKKSYEAKQCAKCAGISIRKVVERPSKEILIQKLKDSNFCQVAKEYNVSDNAIRKWLKSYNVNPKEVYTMAA